MEKKLGLPPPPAFLFAAAALALLLLLQMPAHAQQPYVNNKQLACENKDAANITDGFLCNGLNKSCLSYVSFRAAAPYDSAVTIAYLLKAEATQIASLNNLPSDVATIPFNTLVLVPVSCSCSGDYYQHNSTYKIKAATETYFIISNNTYQGLTTCQAMEAQNPIDYRKLLAGDSLLVPLRCACPTSNQSAAGFKYLLSYMVTWRDSISAIAEKFGADEQAVLDANELTTNSIIFPFTPLLVPLTAEPKILEPPSSSSPPAPSPTEPAVVGPSKSGKTGVFVGVGAAAAAVLLIGLLIGFLYVCIYKRSGSQKKKPVEKEAQQPSLPPKKASAADSSDYYPASPWTNSNNTISSQGVRFAIESLTLYKFSDIQAATGDFKESNRIKGSVYRGSFMGDAAAVKVMKGDVSAEINLLKKVNHSNIIRLSGFCIHQGNSYLVYEYAEKGSVNDWLQNQIQIPDEESNKTTFPKTSLYACLSWQQRVRIACDVADALNYLHNYVNPPYIHKNLKTSNILLDGNFRAKVANFGLARTVENSSNTEFEGGGGGGLQFTRHVIGTQGYMAPEYIENGVITAKLDVFAFGVVMLELLSGKEAAAGAGEKDIAAREEMLAASIKNVLEGENVRGKLEEFMDPNLQNEYPLELAFSMAQLAKQCVARDLNDRPSTAEVLITLSKILSSSLDWDPSDEFDRSTSMSSAR